MQTPTAFVISHESDPNRRQKSTNFIALAITRSLGRHDVPVVRVHPNLLEHGLTSRFCQKVEVCPDFYESEDNLLKFLLAVHSRYAGPRVLIPASDDCAYFVAKHHDQLRRTFEIVGPTWRVMERILDKRSQYEVAQKVGVPIPETHFPAGRDDVKRLANDLRNYPYVIKPTVAHRWRRASMKAVSKGRKGFLVRNPQELVNQYETIRRGDQHVMIQEVIGGSDERLFTFLSYFNERSEPVAYCIRKKMRQRPIDFGYCTLTVTCFNETVEEQSIRLLKGVEYHGISGVEWKRDSKSGQYKLIEINARAVNTIGISAACGVDIPYIAFMDKAGYDVTPVRAWKEGVKWISTTQDLWAARDLNRIGALSLKEWWRSIRGTNVDAIYTADDLKPFVGYGVDFLKSLSRAFFKRLSMTRSEIEDVTTAELPGNPAS